MPIDEKPGFNGDMPSIVSPTPCSRPFSIFFIFHSFISFSSLRSCTQEPFYILLCPIHYHPLTLQYYLIKANPPIPSGSSTPRFPAPSNTAPAPVPAGPAAAASSTSSRPYPPAPSTSNLRYTPTSAAVWPTTSYDLRTRP